MLGHLHGVDPTSRCRRRELLRRHPTHRENRALIYVNPARRNNCHAPARVRPDPARRTKMKHQGEIPRQPRRDRLICEHVHDPYKTRLKLPEPHLAPNVGRSSTKGAGIGHRAPTARTRSSARHVTVSMTAIRRASSRSSAWFVPRHKEEILHLARHQEEQEKAEHPLHRIMSIQEKDGAIVVQTTDIHSSRGELVRRCVTPTGASSIAATAKRPIRSASAGPAMAEQIRTVAATEALRPSGPITRRRWRCTARLRFDVHQSP